MKEEIEQYTLKEPSVVATGEHRVRAFVGDQTAKLGDTLWVGDEPTRIVALAGSRRVEAIAFDTSNIAVGHGVRVGEQVAGWPAPASGEVALEALRFEPGRVVEPTPVDVPPEVFALGLPLDEHLPVVRHGVTLLLDTGAPDETFDQLYRAIRRTGVELVGVAGRALGIESQVLGANGLALTVGAQWAAERGGVFVIEAEPFDLDELLDPLRGKTVVVRVHLREGLEIIAESLDLGRSDTELLVREDSSIDLSRSESRLTDTTRFGRIAEVREQLAIFGEHDLEPGDAELLAEVNRFEQGWLG